MWSLLQGIIIFAVVDWDLTPKDHVLGYEVAAALVAIVALLLMRLFGGRD